jgi:hypothetical protein
MQYVTVSILSNNSSNSDEIGKMYSLEYTDIPAVLFT